MKKILIMIISILLLTSCQSTHSEISIQQAYGEHKYQELYYVSLLNPSIPDTIEQQMEVNNKIIIDENTFQFQNTLLKDATYIEDEFNTEEEQLSFKKKYKVYDYGADAYYRIYMTSKDIYVGIYYNTQSLRYIIKVK